jgi:hypothetical protein
VERLSEVLGHRVQFSYTAWDRIVLNGYLERLQRPENVVHLFREVLGEPCVTPEVLASRTAPYRAWVARYAAAQAVPVLAAPKGVRKEEVVAPYYRRFRGAEGVVCVLASLERGSTFVSYTPRYPPPSGDPHYRRIRRCRKRFLHYYFYVQDSVMGPMSLRVATFLPFNVTCYLNGHSFLARELTRAGVAFRKEANAFLAVADPAALAAADARMTAALAEYGAQGWEPASPVEWREVVAADRFVAEMRAPRWWPLSGLIGGRPVLRQVLMRFRRAA